METLKYYDKNDDMEHLLNNVNNNRFNSLFNKFDDIEQLYINYFKYNKIMILDE